MSRPPKKPKKPGVPPDDPWPDQGDASLGEIDDAKIREALLRSGFPLEVRLRKKLIEHKYNPAVAQRIKVGEDEPLKDLDLLGNLSELIPYGDNTEQKDISLRMNLLIEAKSPGPSTAFVGFPVEKTEHVSDHGMCLQRARCGGGPSYMVKDHDYVTFEAMGRAGGIAEAFQPLNDAPLCVQWSLARLMPQKKPPFADRDIRLWNSMNSLVRGCYWHNHVQSDHVWGRPLMSWQFPVLVIATPALRVYDVEKDKIDEVEHLIVEGTYEADDGVRVESYLDVVSEAGFPSLLERYKAVMAAVRERCIPLVWEIEVAMRAHESRIQEQAKRRTLG